MRSIIDNLARLNPISLKSRGLRRIFADILSEVEGIRGSMQLSDIFELIGHELSQHGVNSIVSIINERRNEMIVRYINFPEEMKKILSSDNIKNQEFRNYIKYKEAIQRKESVYCSSRFSGLEKILLETKDSSRQKEARSIISPLLLKNEIIGTLEIVSPDLERKDLFILDEFVKKLVISITNNILFHEIKESERRYRRLFQNSSEGLVFFNLKEKRFKESNIAMKKISGYTSDELKQIHYVNIFLREERKRIDDLMSSIRNNKNPDSLPIKMCARIVTKLETIKVCELEIGLHGNWEEVYFKFDDVTEQKNIEVALRDSEEKYRMLVDNAEDGVLMYDLEGKINFFNKAILEILEAEKDEMIGKYVLDLIADEDKELVAIRFKDRIAGKSVISNYDFRVKTLRGNIKYINFSGALIVKNGKKIGIQAIVRDISKSKELEQLIRNTKRHYVSIIDSIQDDILVISEDWNIVTVNSSFSKNVGKSFQEIKGKACSQIMAEYKNGVFGNHCFTGDCESDCVFLKVFGSGEPEYFIEKGGDSRYFGVGVFPVNSGTEIKQLIITIRDVTESKRAEEENLRLTEFNQKILDLSPASIVVLDREGRIISSNDMALRLLGESSDRHRGTLLSSTIAIRDNAELLVKYDKLLRAGEPFFHDNLSYADSSSGEIRYLSIIAVPLFNQDKGIDGAISMAVDNTEKVLAEEKLRGLNRELEEKVKIRTEELDNANKELSKVLELKSKFISDASHELRTPLTVIQGNLDLAKQEFQSELPEAFRHIGKEVEQMTGILADLTMLTNTDAASETINHGTVDANLIADAVVQTLKVLAKQKNIELRLLIEGEENELIGDESKLEKMLLNIVRNAIKYTEENGVIEVRTRRNKEQVEFVVSDTGIGIPEEDLPYIFERFYRVDKARSRKEGGTGLGLSICKWIVEAHGGKISVASEIGVGSVFTISLPIGERR